MEKSEGTRRAGVRRSRGSGLAVGNRCRGELFPKLIAESGGLVAGGFDERFIEGLGAVGRLLFEFGGDEGFALLVEFEDFRLDFDALFGGFLDVGRAVGRSDRLHFRREVLGGDFCGIDLLFAQCIDEVPRGVAVVDAGFGD